MTAARRAAAFCHDAAAPVVWLFALLGAGLALFAADWWEPDFGTTPRPSGAVRVGVEPGWRWFPLAPFSQDSYHPRVLVVERLGRSLAPYDWEADGPVPDNELHDRYDATGQWDDEENAVTSPAAGLLAGRTLTYPADFTDDWAAREAIDEAWDDPDAPDPPVHLVTGVAVSLWPLLTLGAVVAAVRWGRRRRRRARDPDFEPRPPSLVRRLVRPWVLLSAAVGLWGTALHHTPLGPATWAATVARGPAAAPHPRVLTLTADWKEKTLWDEDAPHDRSRPLWGVWLREERISGLGGGLGGGGFGGAFSLPPRGGGDDAEANAEAGVGADGVRPESVVAGGGRVGGGGGDPLARPAAAGRRASARGGVTAAPRTLRGPGTLPRHAPPPAEPRCLTPPAA